MKALSLTRLDNFCSDEILLGHWCLQEHELYKKNGSGRDVLEYQNTGDDFHGRSKKVTTKAYNTILPLLKDKLNAEIGRNYSLNFWNIFLGAWLRQYLEVLYDRYTILLHAKQQLRNSRVRASIPSTVAPVIALNADQFSTFVFTDKFNQQMFGDLIRELNLFPYKNITIVCAESTEVGRKKRNKLLMNIFNSLFLRISRNSTILIANSYLSTRVLLRGWMSGLWRPLLFTPKFIVKKNVDIDARKKAFSFSDISGITEFEELSLRLLKTNIPTLFFEQLDSLHSYASSTVPKQLKCFITANVGAVGDLGRFWVGLIKEEKALDFVIMQHGANYGQSSYITDEDFELGVADHFLTAGWSTIDKVTYNKCTVSKLSGLRTKRYKNVNGPITLVLASLPRYYYCGWSAPQGPQFVRYIDSLKKLKALFSEKRFNQIVCREYTYNYGWNDRDYLQSLGYKFPNVNRKQSLISIMKKSRIVIFTYNSTALLEALALDIPFCAFWDTSIWGFRPNAARDLDAMQKVGLFHNSEESLVKFVEELSDVRAWWYSADVELAKAKYKSIYARAGGDEVEHWRLFLNSKILKNRCMENHS